MWYYSVTLRICLLFLSLTIGPLVNSTSTRDRRNSGIYIGNDQNRTMIHNSTAEEATVALRQAILELLGLPDRPNSVTGRAPSKNRSAVNFLLNIYKNTVDDEPMKGKNNSEEWRNFVLTDANLRTISESDSIVAFSAKQKHRLDKPNRVKRIWFDVGAAPKDNHMISAELRLYHRDDAKNRKNRGSFTITVYRVVRTSSNETKMQSVDSINTAAGQQGWITLNVTESMDYWMKNPKDNRGFYLSVHPIDDPLREKKPENIGIAGFKDDAEHHPFMAVFFKSTSHSQSRMNHGPTLDDINGHFNKIRKRETSVFKGRCEVRPLYVNFTDLQWQDWIIAPEGYYANYCGGECNFPIPSHMNPTNHAIVQVLQNLLHSSKVPKPCCTSNGLKGIPVLYFDVDDNPILGKFKKMVVRSCGCR